MRISIAAAFSALAGTAQSASRPRGVSSPSQQLCQGTAAEEQGNWYCQQVQGITYQNLGRAGEYREVVSMDQATGECKFAARPFSGPLAPFNEPLSLHFRGPLNLRQVAVYMPASRGVEIRHAQRRGAGPGIKNNGDVPLDVLREHRRASPQGHHQHPHAQGKEAGARPQAHARGAHEASVGMDIAWPLGSSSRYEIWQLAPSAELNLGAGAADVTVTTVVTATTLVTQTVRTCETESQGLPAVAPSMTASSSSSGDTMSAGVMSDQSSASTSASGAAGSGSAATVASSVPPGSSSGSGFFTSARRKCSSAVTPLSPSTAATSGFNSRSTSTPDSAAPANNPTIDIVPGPSGAPGTTSPGTRRFVRTGYYNAAQGKAEGLMFLGNYGGQGSGKWTPTFGNTLSYVNAAGTGGAAGPEVLDDTVLLSSHEVILTTNEPCDDACGYLQHGSVAYKGFPGATKLFLLAFSMPHNTSSPARGPFPPPPGSPPPPPGNDQPAIWLLNARIPYTSQYAAQGCSCWASGCGEVDVAEVLAPGLDKVTTAVRGGGGGAIGTDGNYFARPADVRAPVRMAVLFDGESGEVSVRMLGVAAEGEEFPGEIGVVAGEGGAVSFEGLREAEGMGEGVGSLFRFGG